MGDYRPTGIHMTEGELWEERHNMRRLAEHLGIPDASMETDVAFVRRSVEALAAERDEWKAKAIAHPGEHLGSCVSARRELIADRDEWRRKLETATKIDQAMVRDRDEWRRRAEAAEAKACPCGCNAMREGPTHMSGAAMALTTPEKRFRSGTTQWVDPLDLLADDA